MSITASAPTVKPRITPDQQVRWLEAAKGFLRDGESMDAVDAFLQAEGCPPRLRRELLRQANAGSLGKHRGNGLRLLATGLGVIALGAEVVWWAMSSGGMHHSGRLAFAGTVIAVVGLQMGLVGAWKMLTGSRVDVTAERG